MAFTHGGTLPVRGATNAGAAGGVSVCTETRAAPVRAALAQGWLHALSLSP